MIDLTKIELSTDADKESQLDLWARFFKAETWEEIMRELTTENEQLHARIKELEAELAQQIKKS